MSRHCILCLRALPAPPWWKRILGPPPSRCGPKDDRLGCWRKFNERMGLDPNRPMPGPRS